MEASNSIPDAVQPKKRKRFDPELFENSQRNRAKKRIKIPAFADTDSDSDGGHHSIPSHNQEKEETNKTSEIVGVNSDSDKCISSRSENSQKVERNRANKKRKIIRIVNDDSESDNDRHGIALNDAESDQNHSSRVKESVQNTASLHTGGENISSDDSDTGIQKSVGRIIPKAVLMDSDDDNED